MATGYIRGTSASSSSRRGYASNGGRNTKRDDNNERRRMQSQVVGAQVQNVKAARVYVFGNDNVAEDDETVEFEMPEMRSRLKGSSPFSRPEEDEQPEFFEKEIDEGETLQAIALKYACAVSELKRLNNLIQDQDFYALKVVKVPMKKHGIFSEQLANNKEAKFRQHSRTVNGATFTADFDQESSINDYDESDSQHDFSDPDTQIKVMRTLSIRDNLSRQGKEAEKFLQKMDADLTKFKQSSRSERESLSEVISVLTNKSIQPLHSSRSTNKHNGATCGISWWSILGISLIIGIFAPILVYLYIKFVMS